MRQHALTRILLDGFDLVLSSQLEVAGIVPFVQLLVRFAGQLVDDAPSLLRVFV